MDSPDQPVREKIPVGLTLIIAYHILSLVSWIACHVLSISYYSEFASWGLRDEEEETQSCLTTGLERGEHCLGSKIFALAFSDFVILIPLVLTSYRGLVIRQSYGATCSWMVFGINIYRSTMIMWLEGMLIDRKSSERIILFQRSIVYMHLIMAVLGAFFQHLLFQKGKL
mmetsp:Transcript_31030/g.61856  ORF Transcript_31030/g.61856 Transcript_31030/m.61856 type:complete len:170 (+) Transcript_31030:228-737(+)